MVEPAAKDTRPPSGRSKDGVLPPSILLVGASFKTAKIGTRERLARRLADFRELSSWEENRRVLESATIVTCNRLELYIVSPVSDEVAAMVTAKLGGGVAALENFYVKKGVEAVRLIFRVAAGLDSVVVGEEQILEQEREAGRTARTAGRAKSVLAALFDAAYSSGRRIRESYRVPPGHSSVSAFALSRAVKELGHRPAAILLVGSGETAKLAALTLKGATVYLLSDRRGAEARFPNALRISRRRLREVAEKCDLIIAATRRRGYALSGLDLPRDRRMVVLDLGFPRNVDPSIKRSDLTKLYDLDAIAEWALRGGRRGNGRAESLAEEEARRFVAWLTASRLTPTLANIYRWGEKIREEETLAALRKLPDLSERERGIVESLSRRITGKLLSPHAAFVKEVGSEGDQRERLLLLETIFGGDGRRAQ